MDTLKKEFIRVGTFVTRQGKIQNNQDLCVLVETVVSVPAQSSTETRITCVCGFGQTSWVAVTTFGIDLGSAQEQAISGACILAQEHADFCYYPSSS